MTAWQPTFSLTSGLTWASWRDLERCPELHVATALPYLAGSLWLTHGQPEVKQLPKGTQHSDPTQRLD